MTLRWDAETPPQEVQFSSSKSERKWCAVTIANATTRRAFHPTVIWSLFTVAKLGLLCCVMQFANQGSGSLSCETAMA